MIGYQISYNDLAALVAQKSPNWINRATQRTTNFRQQRRYAERSPMWSEIKTVYIRLQGGKCAYCERQLEGEVYGKSEYDIEHFRPKGNVKGWSLSSVLSQQGITPTPVPNGTGGYYLLPYHLFNYAVACKPCNSVLKETYFPIAGTYDLSGHDPVALLQAEQPYLIYPIGDFDKAPEALIRFEGISPCPVVSEGHDHDRALVTIELFKLDDVIGRKNLFLERVRIMIALFPQLEILADGATGDARKWAMRVIDLYTSCQSPHTNCARSFVSLYNQNPSQARQLWEAALTVSDSTS